MGARTKRPPANTRGGRSLLAKDLIYDKHKKQLGVGKSYAQFLSGMEDVARELFRVMKKGAFTIYNVGDIRKKGRFYPYHADVIHLMQRAGFRCHDVWVVAGLVAGFPKIFALQHLKNKVAPKCHEYALVFKK